MHPDRGVSSILSRRWLASDLKLIYLRQIIVAFSNGFASPFVSVFLVQLKASASSVGLLSSLTNLISNVFQPFWGAVSDFFGKRSSVVVLGGAGASVIWLLAIGTRTAQYLIELIALQAFLNSMVTPALSALVGELSPSMRRGRVAASINLFSSLGSLVATLISGYMMMKNTGSLTTMYAVPFALAGSFGLAGNLVMLKVKEHHYSSRRSINLGGLVQPLREDDRFRHFAVVSFWSMLIQSLPWGLFPFVMIDVVHADMFQVAVISAINGASIMVVQRTAGRLVDKYGRKPFVLAGKFGLSAFPLFYAFASSVTWLYLGNFESGIFNGLLMVAVFAYLVDVSPVEKRGSYFGVYNGLTGVAMGIGALVGGYLGDFMIGEFGLILGLRYALVLIASARFLVNLQFFGIEESRPQA